MGQRCFVFAVKMKNSGGKLTSGSLANDIGLVCSPPGTWEDGVEDFRIVEMDLVRVNANDGSW